MRVGFHSDLHALRRREGMGEPAFPPQGVGMPVLFLGDDVVRFEEEIRSTLGKQACFGTPQENIPRPASLAWLAYQKWSRQEQPEPPDYSPEYWQRIEAEANWLKKQRKDGGNG